MKPRRQSPDLLAARELRLRLAVDVGGTFTDLVLEDERGALELHKSSTTPDDPVRGVMNVLGIAESARETDLEKLLSQTDLFIFGTTRATNAILTGNTAKTAFLTTKGHPDVLLFRQGGRVDTFDNTRKYPGPYVPRALTYEVTERIGPVGRSSRRWTKNWSSASSTNLRPGMSTPSRCVSLVHRQLCP